MNGPFKKKKTLLSVFREIRVSHLITPLGRQSLHYLAIHRRTRSPKIGQITRLELRSISRYLIHGNLIDLLLDLLTHVQAVPANPNVTKAYPTKSNDLAPLSSLTNKVIRLGMVDEEAGLICLYKVGAILDPGEVSKWTHTTRKLTSTRHRNILLRVAHGDIFSNDRLFRFGLRDTSNCSNCPELIETTRHRLFECPVALQAWNNLENLKVKTGLNRMSDLSIENLLGAKDKITKLELALNAELLMKLSTRSEPYCPQQLAHAALKLISYSERLKPEQRQLFKNALTDTS